MEVPSTYKNHKNAGKPYKSEADGSFKKDIFIIVAGLVLVLLGFLLFGAVSGLQLDKGFPVSGKVVVGDDGELVEASYSKISPEAAQEYLKTGLILSLVVFVGFAGTSMILRWIKKEKILRKIPRQ